MSFNKTAQSHATRQPQPVPPPKVPGEPAPDEDKCNLPDQLVSEDGDATNQPAFNKEQLRRLPAD